MSLLFKELVFTSLLHLDSMDEWIKTLQNAQVALAPESSVLDVSLHNAPRRPGTRTTKEVGRSYA